MSVDVIAHVIRFGAAPETIIIITTTMGFSFIDEGKNALSAHFIPSHGNTLVGILWSLAFFYLLEPRFIFDYNRVNIRLLFVLQMN